MKTLAAVLVETGKPLVIEEVETPALKPGQVLVEIKYSGVCHTQVSECRGWRGQDAYLPHLLGHEGSGVVLEVGASVSKVKPGDRVLLSWIKGSGLDVPGSIYTSARGSINAGGITTFSRHSVISENRLTVLPKETTLEEAAILGCAVATGVGSVLNTAGARTGQSIVIFGVGGIGMCAVAGARLAGCTPVVAVDINEQKLELAKKLGATHSVKADNGDVLAAVRSAAPRGFDVAIEASGRPEVMSNALKSVRNQGGIAVVLGNAKFGSRLEIDPRELNNGKQLRGSWGGDCQPDTDFPRYFALLTSGRLDLSSIISEHYPLSRVNDAIDDLESGRTIRPLIGMSLP